MTKGILYSRSCPNAGVKGSTNSTFSCLHYGSYFHPGVFTVPPTPTFYLLEGKDYHQMFVVLSLEKMTMEE